MCYTWKHAAQWSGGLTRDFEHTFVCCNSKIDPKTPSVHKMVKHTLKIMQQMLQEIQRVSEQFVDMTRYGVNVI